MGITSLAEGNPELLAGDPFKQDPVSLEATPKSHPVNQLA